MKEGLHAIYNYTVYVTKYGEVSEGRDEKWNKVFPFKWNFKKKRWELYTVFSPDALRQAIKRGSACMLSEDSPLACYPEDDEDDCEE